MSIDRLERLTRDLFMALGALTLVALLPGFAAR